MPFLAYTPRTEQANILRQVIGRHLVLFQEHMAAKGKRLPAYVLSEFNGFLGCGNLENGFIHLKCVGCQSEKLLAFSCKRRGFCPSCCQRRMLDTNFTIAKTIFPSAPSRQWVLSLPIALRFLASRNRDLLNDLVCAFEAALLELVRAKLSRQGVGQAKGGGVVFIQRLGGSLNLNIHFHAVVLDGGYARGESGLAFHALTEINEADMEAVVRRVAKLSAKALKRSGLWQDLDEESERMREGVEICDLASVQNLIAYGPRSGQKVRRIRFDIDQAASQKPSGLTVELEGFNLKADPRILPHDRAQLERLIRYMARPPVSLERLRWCHEGQALRYQMKKAWKDGTSEIILSPVELLERLAAAVPLPRGHLVRYFGVLAPNAKWRRQVVLKPKVKTRPRCPGTTAKQRQSWADLMKQTFGFEVMRCDVCSLSYRRLAIVRDRRVISKILAQRGIVLPPRAPPATLVGTPDYNEFEEGI